MKLRDAGATILIVMVVGLIPSFIGMFSEPTCEIETTIDGMVVVETFPQSVCDDIQGRKE